MGVCATHHRAVIGLYNNYKIRVTGDRHTQEFHYNGNSGSGGQVMYVGNVLTMSQVVCFIFDNIYLYYTIRSYICFKWVAY